MSNLQQLLEALIGIGLDARFELRVRDQLIALTRDLWSCFAPVRLPEASLDDSLLVTSHCYELIISYLHSSTFSLVDDQVDIFALDEIPEPVAFRGDMDLGKVETTLKIEGKSVQQVLRLMESLEDHDDVQKVHTNISISE